MRFCGTFCAFCEVRDAEKCPQMHTFAGESIDSSLLPVDDADCVPHPETGLAQGCHRFQRGACGRDHVLDETGQIALLEGPLELLARPVALRLLADDHE